MSRHAVRLPKRPEVREGSRRGDLEISTLAKWVLLVVFIILVVIILAKVLTTGEGEIGSLCERTGGFIGC